jgi:hypothetical protein
MALLIKDLPRSYVERVVHSQTGKLLGKERHSQLLVDHKGKDSHLGGTALVELDGTLLELGLLIKGVPAEVDGSVTEVSGEFRFTGEVLHDRGLKDSNEEKELDKSTSGDLLEGGETVGDGRKGLSGVVDGSRKTDTGFLDKVSNNGEHRDTSVLDLDGTETVELLLVTIGDKSKGIKESKRSLGTELVFEGHVGGNRSTGSVLGRGEGGGTGDEGGDDNGLHFDYCCWGIVREVQLVAVKALKLVEVLNRIRSSNKDKDHLKQIFCPTARYHD